MGNTVALIELEQLVVIQKQRVNDQIKREKDMAVPTPQMLEATSKLVESYQSTLETLHKLQVSIKPTVPTAVSSVSEQIKEAMTAHEKAVSENNIDT
jgi:hypothetical protein